VDILYLMQSKVLFLLPISVEKLSSDCSLQILNLICKLFYISKERGKSILVKYVADLSCQRFLLHHLNQKFSVPFIQHVGSEMMEKLWALAQFDIFDKLMQHVNLVIFKCKTKWGISSNCLGV